MGTIRSVLTNKNSVAQLLRGSAGGLSIKTYIETTISRAHLDKYLEFVKTP